MEGAKPVPDGGPVGDGVHVEAGGPVDPARDPVEGTKLVADGGTVADGIHVVAGGPVDAARDPMRRPRGRGQSSSILNIYKFA